MAGKESRAGQLAQRYFREEHNCAMAVLRAVSETEGLGCDACVPGMALAMGGGLGHTGHACGALTGGVMAIGLAVDRFTSGPLAEKKDEAYLLAAGLVNHFCDAQGAANCAVLLGFNWTDPGAKQRWHQEGRDKCLNYVAWTADETVRIVETLRGRK